MCKLNKMRGEVKRNERLNDLSVSNICNLSWINKYCKYKSEAILI